MKVYVIEKGAYSDRHVVGVVESEKEAKEICKAISDNSFGGEATYEEYDTGKFQTNRLRFLVFEPDSTYVTKWTAEYDSYDTHKNIKENTQIGDGIYIVYAKSQDVAIKIAQDMRAEKLAKEKGVLI